MDYVDSQNGTDFPTTPITPTDSEKHLTYEIFFILSAIAGGVCNFLIIYTIFRFKRTRTAPYIFLANWAFADLLSLVLQPRILRIASLLENVAVSFKIYCYLTQTSTILHSGAVLLVALVALDWTLAAYFPRAGGCFRKWYRVVLAVIWTYLAAMVLVGLFYCSLSYYDVFVSMLLVILTLFVTILLVIGIQITRLVKLLRKTSSDHSGLAINLTTAFLACWFLFVADFVLSIHHVVSFLAICSIYLSSMVNLGLLYRFDGDFCACFKQVVSCRRIEYQEEVSERVLIQNANSDNVTINICNAATNE